MNTGWITLIPPLIVVSMAFITKRLNLSLISGIIASGIVACHGDLSHSFTLISKRLATPFSDPDSLYLYAFLLLIGILVTLFVHTGCTQAFAHVVSQRLKDKRAVETSSTFISIMLAVDDYLSILTTGYVMSSVIDRFGIARAKLAYLIHSLAGVVVILAPVSSWVAAITGYLINAGINSNTLHAKVIDDPFFVYLKSIPFIFYSLLTIFSVFLIIRKRISYGPMEDLETSTHSSDSRSNSPFSSDHTSLSEFLIPLGALVGITFVGIPYAGGFWLLGGERSFFEALQKNTHTFLVMLIGAAAALLTAFILGYLNKRISCSNIPFVVWKGAALMKTAIIMVFLASILSVMLRVDVQTGQHVAYLIQGVMILPLIPSLFFIISLICAIATGSAWGTIALMTSIAIPMLVSLMGISSPATLSSLPLLCPMLGAIFSGAVCGDHISPFSETTIMAATSCGVDPLVHFYTQLPYAIPAIVGSIVAFLVSGLLINSNPLLNALISISVGMSMTATLLLILNKKDR